MVNIFTLKDKTIVSISLITAVCLLGNSMLYVTLPIYWQEAGLNSLWEVGVLLSINRIVRLPINAFIGWLYSEITIRLGFLLAIAFSIVATLGYGFFKGFICWIILRVFWGIAWSLLKLGGFLTVLMETKGNERGHLIGKYNGLHRLGDLFGMALGGLLSGLIGFKTTLIIFGLIMVLAIPITLIFVPNYYVANNRLEKEDEKIHFSFSVIRVVLGGLIIAMLFEGVVASTLSLLIDNHFHEGIIILGMGISTVSLSGFLQGIRWFWEPFLAPLFGRWSDIKGARQSIFRYILVLASIGFILVAFALPLIIWIIVTLFLMVSATALVTLSDSLASDIASQISSIKIMTIYTIALDIGAAIGPFFSYQLIILESGLFYTYVLGAILLLLIAFLWRVSKTRI